MSTAAQKLSRNNPCPCGSGKKFKRCCLSTRQQQHCKNRIDPPLLLERNKLLKQAHQARVSQHRNQKTVNRKGSTTDSQWYEVTFDAPLPDNRGCLQVMMLFSREGMETYGLTVNRIHTLNLPEIKFQGRSTILCVKPSPSRGSVEGKIRYVVQFRDEDDLGKVLLGEWEPSAEFMTRWRENRRIVRMRITHPDGSTCEADLVRSLKWMKGVGAEEVGGQVFLDLPEMDARGWAEIWDILPCPEMETREGGLLTGIFRHSHGRAGELVLENQGEPIGVTPRHLFWSVDRSDWVPVEELEPGETLKTWNGFDRVLSYTHGEKPVPVYNFEVAYDHVYRVGEQGILVHNTSVPCDSMADRRRRYYYREIEIPERHGATNQIATKVVDRVISWIRPKDFADGTVTDAPVREWIQSVVGVDERVEGHIDAAGHIIARELGGKGELAAKPLNIFPQKYGLNNGLLIPWWRNREKEVISLFNSECPQVCVRILLRYPKKNDPSVKYPARPIHLIYDLWVDGVQRPTAEGENPE